MARDILHLTNEPNRHGGLDYWYSLNDSERRPLGAIKRLAGQPRALGVDYVPDIWAAWTATGQRLPKDYRSDDEAVDALLHNAGVRFPR